MQRFICIVRKGGLAVHRVDDGQGVAEGVVCLGDDTAVGVRSSGGVGRDVIRILRHESLRGAGNGWARHRLQAPIVWIRAGIVRVGPGVAVRVTPRK